MKTFIQYIKENYEQHRAMGGQMSRDEYEDDHVNVMGKTSLWSDDALDHARSLSSYSPEHHEKMADFHNLSGSTLKSANNYLGHPTNDDYHSSSAEKASKVASQFRMNPKLDNAGKDRIMNAVYGHDYAAQRGK